MKKNEMKRIPIYPPGDIYDIFGPIKNNRITRPRGQPEFERWFTWFEKYTETNKIVDEANKMISYEIDFLLLLRKNLGLLEIETVISADLTGDDNPFSHLPGTEFLFLLDECDRFCGMLICDSYDSESGIITLTEDRKDQWLKTMNGLYDKLVFHLTLENPIIKNFITKRDHGLVSIGYTLQTILKALQETEEFKNSSFTPVDLWRIKNFLINREIGEVLKKNIIKSFKELIENDPDTIKFLASLGDDGLPKEKLMDHIVVDYNDEKNAMYLRGFMAGWDGKFAHLK